MIKFDKDGWFVGQKIKLKVNHEHDHDHLYPTKEGMLKYDKSKYIVHDHTTHKNWVEDGLKIVPFHETKYNGEKYKKWNKKSSGALASISKSTKSNRILIIKILIPK